MANTEGLAAGPVPHRITSRLATFTLIIGLVAFATMVGVGVWRNTSPNFEFPSWKNAGSETLDMVLTTLVRVLGGLLGLVLGIIALVIISRNASRLKGKGRAIIGIVFCALACLISPVVAVLIPAWAAARMTVNLTVSMGNMNGLCKAALTYAENHDKKLPSAESFPQVLQIPEYMLKDPFLPSTARGYSMNAEFSNAVVTSPQAAKTVLFFECRADAPCAGGRTNLRALPGHRKGYVIGFLDGHVEVVAPRDVDGLVWSSSN